MFQKFWYWLRFRRKTKRFKGYNKKLQEEIVIQRIKKRKLKAEIIQDVRKFIQVNANSKYIKRKKPNRTEIIQYVQAKFGVRMLEQKIAIKKDLTLCDI